MILSKSLVDLPSELGRAESWGWSADVIVVETEGAILCNLGQLLTSAERNWTVVFP